MRNSLLVLSLGMGLALALSVSGACKPVPSDKGAAAVITAGSAAPAAGKSKNAVGASVTKNKDAVAAGVGKNKDAVASPTAKSKDAIAVKHKNAPSHRMMVPPPPPEMPFVGADERQSLTAGVPLDYMSKSDLERLKTRLETQVAKLNKEKSDHDLGLKDKQDRLAQFESLYKEGVVSRRELESARREFKDEQQTGSDFGDRFKDATIDLDRVKKQLSTLEKRQGKVSLKKSSASSKENAHRDAGKSTGSADKLAVEERRDASTTTSVRGSTTPVNSAAASDAGFSDISPARK